MTQPATTPIAGTQPSPLELLQIATIMRRDGFQDIPFALERAASKWNDCELGAARMRSLIQRVANRKIGPACEQDRLDLNTFIDEARALLKEADDAS